MRVAVLTEGVSGSLPMRRFEAAKSTPVELRAVTRKDPDPASAFVEFENVQKTYDGEHLALADLNLSIFQGEFLTLLGPSGSGKTTALMMLAGFEVPTAGEIRLRGKSLLRVPHYRRNIGVVFQNYALFPHMTVAENLSFPLLVRKVRQLEVKDRVARALELVQLQGFDNRRPAELSGGQQQRIALARALIFDPVLVLMDEPLGALDKQLREQLQIEIKHIQKHLGLTVVYVTHDQTEALTMSDRIAVLKDGSIQQLATPGDLYDRPQNAFVAQFIGENNRLSGVLRAIDSGGRCTVEIADGHTLEAMAVNIGPVGSRTTLSIRPERVMVHPAERECNNILTARVEELIYHGDHTRARLQVADSSDFLIKVSNTLGELSIAPGDMIEIGWRSSDCRALDAGELTSGGQP
jgi:putative spermidine/putrescine transport system ATP-binding protein